LAGGASFEVVMCPALLDEIREVLTDRPRLRKWISLETATLFTDTIGTLVDLVDNPEQIDTETRDPDDDYLIALARANDVEFIVSGDKDLLECEPQRSHRPSSSSASAPAEIVATCVDHPCHRMA
jgi:putative PIN family toxin of toxin-antitoxin system